MNTSASQSPSQRPVLAIVCGLPATGKSTLARKLEEQLRWPLFAKDDFKELLFDRLEATDGVATRAQSTAIGRQAIAAMFMVAHKVIANGYSCIIEANLLPELATTDLEPFMEFANLHQVHCSIPDDLVIERYRARSTEGSRHPVHADHEAIDDLILRIEEGAGRPLPIDAPLLTINTIDGFDPPLEQIVEFLRRS